MTYMDFESLFTTKKETADPFANLYNDQCFKPFDLEEYLNPKAKAEAAPVMDFDFSSLLAPEKTNKVCYTPFYEGEKDGGDNLYGDFFDYGKYSFKSEDAWAGYDTFKWNDTLSSYEVDDGFDNTVDTVFCSSDDFFYSESARDFANYECGFSSDAPSLGEYECGFSSDAPSLGEYECGFSSDDCSYGEYETGTDYDYSDI